MTTRRGFLSAILAAAAAPAIVRAQSLMPVAPRIWTPPGVMPMEIGRWEGMRFIESRLFPRDETIHMLDALAYGISVVKISAPRQRAFNVEVCRRAEMANRMGDVVRIERVDPYSIHLDPRWTHGDVLAAGVPARRRR